MNRTPIQKLIDPQRTEIVRYAQTTAERMGQSAFVLQLFTDNFAKGIDSLVQFAVAVMLDKPVFILAPEGTRIPEKVKRMADGIEFYVPDSQASMREATNRLIALATEKGFSA